MKKIILFSILFISVLNSINAQIQKVGDFSDGNADNQKGFVTQSDYDMFYAGSKVTVNAQSGTTYTYVTGDRGKLITHNNASSIAATLPQAGSSFPDGWFMNVQNSGVGTLTITPTTSTINGVSNLVLTTGQSAIIVSDGTNYNAMLGAAAAGGGEANTASNLGGGLANYDSKSGVDLRFNSFTASDFNLASNLVSIDYTNGQTANGSTKGFISSTDWTTFNGKAPSDAEYIVSSSSSGLSNEDVITEGSMIDITNGSGTSTVLVDVNELTTETDCDVDDDFLPIYDGSEAANNKMSPEEILGEMVRDYRKKRYDYYNEFITNPALTSGSGEEMIVTNSGSGAAWSAGTATAGNVVGLAAAATGTTATGRSALSTVATAVRLGGGTWVFETAISSLSNLSTSSERYQLLIGFFDTYTAANQTDGVYFLYDEGGVSTGSAASANWQTVTASNSTRTFTTSSTAVVTTAATLRIEINAAASSVSFFVDGTSIVTAHTTNIPTGSGRELGLALLLIKSVGTTSRTVAYDYLSAQCDYTTSK